MSDRIVAIPVDAQGGVGGGLGKAHRMAVAVIEADGIVSWTEHETNWDVLHDQGEHGAHHARIVRFMMENGVTHVAAAHIGPPMQNTLIKLGLTISMDAAGDAREAALRA